MTTLVPLTPDEASAIASVYDVLAQADLVECLRPLTVMLNTVPMRQP